jgi:class 3 adenylate cyclase
MKLAMRAKGLVAAAAIAGVANSSIANGMTDPITRGVLFCDISDSSRLYQELGNKRASELVRELLSLLSGVVTSAGGTLVDQIGDEILCASDSAEQAVEAAMALQVATADYRQRSADTFRTAVRIGVHFGEVLAEGARLFGNTVYLAKRITDTAKAGQILTSEATLKLLDDDVCLYRYVDTKTFKRQPAPTRLFEILWGEPDTTTQPLRVPDAKETQIGQVLEIETASGVWCLREGESLSLGRAPTCDVTLNSTAASRLHAVIEGRRGRFMLVDMSTNGTFVQGATGAPPRLLRRDELALGERGLLGLGDKPEEQAAHTVRYAQRAAEPS